MKGIAALLSGLILSVSFLCFCANAESAFPNWAEGTLFVSMSGAGQADESNEFSLKKYACLYNFDQGRFTTIEIPKDAHLSKDLGGNNSPIIISRESIDYSEDRGWGSQGRWRSFSVSSFRADPDSQSGGNFFYGIQQYGIYAQEGKYYFSDYGKEMTFDAPVQILEVHSPGYCVYYLEYGVSQSAEIEIRFVCSQDNCKAIFCRYPIDYPWGKWAYAISPNGNVAYKDPASNQIVIYAGGQSTNLPCSENTSQLAWRNDRELLFFANTNLQEDKADLLSYNIDEGHLKKVRKADGSPIWVENAYLCDMDINSQIDCLAYSYISNPNGDSEPRIGLIALREKTCYEWNPCPLRGVRSEESTDLFTGKPITAKVRYGYSVSDDGVYLFEPCNGTDLELAWYVN